MFRHIIKAGQDFQDAMFDYMSDFMSQEMVPDTWKKFLDKEGLIDILHTMLTKGILSISDYRMWFKLDYRPRISIITPLGETEGATIINGI